MVNLKLGRKAIKTDTRTLKLTPYIKSLPPAPKTVDWTKGNQSWGMMLNDTLGCCTIAGIGHAVQVWTMETGSEITVPNAVILEYYEQWDGYVNGDPSTDNGGIELDVLNDWKKNGFAGHTLIAFVDPQIKNHEEIKQAIYLFGGVYIGMNVPNYIMNTVPSVWDIPGDDDDATIEGGHCVFVCGYDNNGVTFISWGNVYKMTWNYWDMFVDEVHCILSQDWVNSKGVDVQGFNIAQLKDDLSQIK